MHSRAEYYQKYRAKLRESRGYIKTEKVKGELSKFQRGFFIAWDGEGYTDDRGVHRYFLLANSLGEHIINEKGLSTKECLEFMLRTANAHKGAIHVCFGASYDINMLFRDINWTTLEQLWKGRTTNKEYGIRWKNYYIKYHARKELNVRDANGTRSCTIWDVFGFFQGTFVKAIQEHLGSDYPDLALITANKARRSQFDIGEKDIILDYCQRELTALVKLMGKIREYCLEAGIVLQSWRGAGSIAEALMKREKITEHKLKTPRELEEAVCCAYFGGRIEILKQGYYCGVVHTYDVNSAYPAAAVTLPSLRNGRWIRSLTRERTPFSLSRVKWSFTVTQKAPCPYYPFPFRDSKGSVYFPPEGEGWYWEPEVSAALDTIETYVGAPDDTIEVLETWNFVPETDVRPFAFISELYELRRRWKREGTMAHYVLKLGLNSIYGKLAQQAGGTYEKPPTYHQLEWAGYITSFTRSTLLRACAQQPLDIVMFTTDGIFSTKPLDVDVSGDLGAWDYKQYKGLLVVQSGVYWVKGPSSWIEQCRGFDRTSIEPGGILQAWTRGDRDYTACSTRFVTMGSCIYNKNLRGEWRTWRTIPRTLRLEPEGKRRFSKDRKETGLIATLPRILPYTHSHPFRRKFMGEAPFAELDGLNADIVTKEHEDTYL